MALQLVSRLATALARFAGTGLLAWTGTAFVGRTITAPAAGITVSNGSGVSGNPTLALANDLAALEGLGSTGIAVRSAADTWVQRSVVGGTGITVTNGNGVSGNPTAAVDQSFSPTWTGTHNWSGVNNAMTATVAGNNTQPLSLINADGTANTAVQLELRPSTTSTRTAFIQAVAAATNQITLRFAQSNGAAPAFQFQSSFDGIFSLATDTTTATGANAVLEAGGLGNALKRSTSSIRFKADLEPLTDEQIDAVLELDLFSYRSAIPTDDQCRRFFGISAEDAAEKTPHLVTWGYRPADREWVEVDGALECRVKEGAEMVPNGFMYDRALVLALGKIKQLEARLAALEAKT